MAKIIVIIGATGTQGGSVINTLAASKDYHIRGITRNVESEKSQALIRKGIQMGASAIFEVTDYGQQLRVYGPAAAQKHEYQQAVNIANAAAATKTLEHYVWSTLPSSAAISDGKYDVPHFESKASADEYIRTSLPDLARKTTFLWVGFYASNVKAPPMAPTLHAPSQNHVWLSPIRSGTIITSAGLEAHNVGVFVVAILAKPLLTLPAKYILAGTEVTTMGDMIAEYGDVSGNPSQLVYIGQEEYDKLFPGWAAVTQMLALFEEVGGRSFSKPGVTALTWRDLVLDQLELKTMVEAFEMIKAL